MRIAFCFLCLCALSLGCNRDPRLSKHEVTELARKAAVASGYDMERYELGNVHWELGRRDGTWTVYFQMPHPQPIGGDILVWIDDRTGDAKVMRGQ